MPHLGYKAFFNNNLCMLMHNQMYFVNIWIGKNNDSQLFWVLGRTIGLKMCVTSRQNQHIRNYKHKGQHMLINQQQSPFLESCEHELILNAMNKEQAKPKCSLDLDGFLYYTLEGQPDSLTTSWALCERRIDLCASEFIVGG